MARLDIEVNGRSGHVDALLVGSQYDERFRIPALTAVREYEERFETTQRRNPDMSPDQVSAFVLTHWYESIKSIRELERMGEIEP